MKYLFDTKGLEVKLDGSKKDYDVSFFGKPIEGNPTLRQYRTDNGDLSFNNFTQCIRDLRYHYDNYLREIRDRKLKKAGVVGAVVLSITALVLVYL